MKDLIKEIIREELGLSEPPTSSLEVAEGQSHDKIPVIVCTDKRGVVFGFTENAKADPISITNARMCLRWDRAAGGVFGLSENGPTADCAISAETERVSLTGITAVFDVSDTALKAWTSAPVEGR